MNVSSKNLHLGIRHAHVVSTIARLRSFSEAARALSIAPSALTATVQQIEAATGAQLFDRQARPIEVTPAGRQFVLDCERLLAVHEEAFANLAASGAAADRRVAVASAPSLVTRVVAPAVTRLTARMPDASIRIYDSVAGEIQDWVKSGETDLAVASRWRKDRDLTATMIGSDPVGLVVSARHGLAGRGRIRLADIVPDEIVSLSTRTGTAELLAASGRIPEPLLRGRIEVFSTIAQLLLIRRGLGVALLPRLAALAVGEEGLVFLEIEDLDLRRSLYLFRRTRGNLTSAAQLLHDLILDQKFDG